LLWRNCAEFLSARYSTSVITFFIKTNKRELHPGAYVCSFPQWLATKISPKAVADLWAGTPVKAV
jgi:hypothetical protein